MLQVGDSELDFNHPPGAFSIWSQSWRRNVRVWPGWATEEVEMETKAPMDNPEWDEETETFRRINRPSAKLRIG